MLRFRFVGVLGVLGLSALALGGCFGRVEYDLLPMGGGGSVRGAGGAGGSSGGADSSSSGGTVGGGGAIPPRERPEEPPRVPPRTPLSCTADCCPDSLEQVTGLGGTPLDADAERPYLSADGRWLVFSSRATNLGSAQPGGGRQVYVYSLSRRAFSAVAAAATPPADGDSEANAVSADGRFVLLTSSSTHWSAGDENGSSDVFLFDRTTSEVILVSRGVAGGAAGGASLGRDLSPDGRFVVYSSAASDLTVGDDNDAWDVFVWDRLTGSTERVSMGPGDQQTNPVPGNHAHISADGRFVSFHSQSQALVPGDGSRSFDVFLFDRRLGAVAKVSRGWSGEVTDGNTFVLGMSDDARFFAAYAGATNLVNVDTNGQNDAFLLDHRVGKATRVNLGLAGEEAETGTTSVTLSHDGTRLSFASASTRLSSARDGVHLQTYVYDRVDGRLSLLSQDRLGAPGNEASFAAELSESGRCFVFASRATNLTPESEDDGVQDLFVGRWPLNR